MGMLEVQEVCGLFKNWEQLSTAVTRNQGWQADEGIKGHPFILRPDICSDAQKSPENNTLHFYGGGDPEAHHP